MPYLLAGRTESFVLHEMTLDLTETLPYLERVNSGRGDGPKATLFHLILHALGETLHQKPGLNRFVSGRRFYQRKGVHLAFAAKKAFDESAPLVTVKVEIPAGGGLADTVARVSGAVGEGRVGPPRPVDKETSLLMALPGFMLRFIIWAGRALDRVNLMPAAMIATDPMYSSAFVANLGSVGLDRTWHHCFEWGNCHLFCVIGKQKKHLFIEGETPVVRDAVQLFFTFDERANDGFAAMKALDVLKTRIERPVGG